MPWSRNKDWEVFSKKPKNLKDDYLKRLRVQERAPSKEYLDELVQAHQMRIPYENLDITDFGKAIELEPEKLAEKILHQKRGGFCFELNGLFQMLLVELGFDAWLCHGRQLRHNERYVVPATHCGVLVYLDGKRLFCDVGYGGPVPFGSLEFKENMLQEVQGEHFYFEKSGLVPEMPNQSGVDTGWYTLYKKSNSLEGKEIKIMQVSMVPYLIMDFYGACLVRAEGNTAFATRQVSVKREDGYVNLIDDELTICEKGRRISRQIKEDELIPVLEKYFDMEVEEEKHGRKV